VFHKACDMLDTKVGIEIDHAFIYELPPVISDGGMWHPILLYYILPYKFLYLLNCDGR